MFHFAFSISRNNVYSLIKDPLFPLDGGSREYFSSSFSRYLEFFAPFFHLSLRPSSIFLKFQLLHFPRFPRSLSFLRYLLLLGPCPWIRAALRLSTSGLGNKFSRADTEQYFLAVCTRQFLFLPGTRYTRINALRITVKRREKNTRRPVPFQFAKWHCTPSYSLLVVALSAFATVIAFAVSYEYRYRDTWRFKKPLHFRETKRVRIPEVSISSSRREKRHENGNGERGHVVSFYPRFRSRFPRSYDDNGT